MAFSGQIGELEKEISRSPRVASFIDGGYNDTWHDFYLEGIARGKVEVPDLPIDLEKYEVLPKSFVSEGKNGKTCDADLVLMPKNNKNSAILLEFKSFCPVGDKLNKAVNQLNIIGNDLAEELDKEVYSYLVYRDELTGEFSSIYNGYYLPCKMFNR